MPQIEWQVNEDNREETVATTPTLKRHWRVNLIALMIVLGVSLGVMYASIKEPAPQPTAAPTIKPTSTSVPTAEFPSLAVTIDREAQALAGGDFRTFMSIQDQSDPVWYQAQSRNFRAWGRPPYNYAWLYYFIGPQPDSLPRDHIALDTLQYRNGELFRETRFYRLRNDQWMRTSPDNSFWGGQYRSFVTPHFDVLFPVEDSNVISTTIDRFEWTYDRACADLDCPPDLRTIKLFIQPTSQQLESFPTDQQPAIWLSSLRILGFYDTDMETARQLNDPVLQTATENLIPQIVQLLCDNCERNWPGNFSGPFYVQAVVAWETDRLSAQPNMRRLLPPAQLSNNIPLIKLESLWTTQNVPSNPEQVANSVIFFIEHKYGVEGVAKFLKAIGPATSFKQAIENSLGVDEIQFEQQWKAWLKDFYAQGS